MRPAAAGEEGSEALDRMNAGLMIMSCAAALAFPFQLYLAAYAVLGPAHYLTQLSWLQRRGFFVRGRSWLLLVLLAYPAQFCGERIGTAAWWAALALSSGLALFGDSRGSAALTAGLVAATLAWKALFGIPAFLSLLLPTIIHVFVFTGAFILKGALERRSRWGLASFGVFLACAAVFFAPGAARGAPALSPYAASAISPFLALNRGLVENLGGRSPAAMMGFMAYVYTYHYLNWFSKTRLIGWGEVSPARAGLLVSAYAASLALFAWRYDAGFACVSVASTLHVLLEFPLDCRALAGLGAALGARLRLAGPGRNEAAY